MRNFYKITIAVIAFCTACAGSVVAMEPMPFKIGFEFQMHGDLCKWALGRQDLQKQSIFSFELKEGYPLCHVELDGPDIEFVTVPFSYGSDGERDLKECMTVIVTAVNIMMQLSNSDGQTTIGKWFEVCKGKCIKKEEKALLAKTGNGIIKKLDKDWIPTWQPQITVQHPLQCTIKLCSRLFEGTIIRASNIKEALPFYNPVSDIEKPLYNTALGGLIFLLAHEMSGINKSTTFSAQDIINLDLRVMPDSSVSDAYMMSDTLRSFKDDHQFDAKRRTLFMSRRPFNHMLAEILANTSIPTISDKQSLGIMAEKKEFSEAFKFAMNFNNFFKKLKVQDNFWRANYAEQFYDDQGSPLDLSVLVAYFDDEVKALPQLIELLRYGLLSTAMFRHIEKAKAEEILSPAAETAIKLMGEARYYDAVLASVQNPRPKMFLKITKEASSGKILINAVQASFPVDLISPPFPLDINDAMGYYREKSTECPPEIFGSAIVELRSIEYVRVLVAEGNHGEAEFLKNPKYLEEEALKLFKCLSDLTMQK